MIKRRSKKKEYCSNIVMPLARDLGKKEKSILEPSKGGIGTKLNIPSAKFTTTIKAVME